MNRGLHVAAIKRLSALLTLFAAAALSVAAEKERPGTFSMPGSILLFGTYDDLRVVTPDREVRLTTPPAGRLQIQRRLLCASNHIASRRRHRMGILYALGSDTTTEPGEVRPGPLLSRKRDVADLRRLR